MKGAVGCGAVTHDLSTFVYAKCGCVTAHCVEIRPTRLSRQQAQIPLRSVFPYEGMRVRSRTAARGHGCSTRTDDLTPLVDRPCPRGNRAQRFPTAIAPYPPGAG